ncbi:MAG TPA: hypothetical protein VKQ36_13585 [Ktedonobacterales bacterium]|nr:hypothetical protein [Ktedonobacterales bacterium]
MERSQRAKYLHSAQALLERYLPPPQFGGLFWELDQIALLDAPQTDDALHALLAEAKEKAEPLFYILANVVIQALTSDIAGGTNAFLRAFQQQKALIETLPFSSLPCVALHHDARDLPLESGALDLIVTSPPYINVFNYHQNYRAAMEYMGWDMLRIAKSEFGSNRKNRGNRFLTVVQYMLDMLQSLREMRRVLRPSGRLIIVVGRTSSIRGISFQNGRIVGTLALGAAGMRLERRQERVFKTKFGETIYEDILIFTPDERHSTLRDESNMIAYELARIVLAEALIAAKEEVQPDILMAIRQASQVQPSPYFKALKLKNQGFIAATWYNPDEALHRGSFI